MLRSLALECRPSMGDLIKGIPYAYTIARALRGLRLQFVAVAALAMALVCGRVLWDQLKRGSEATEALEELVRLPQEPMRPSKRLTLTAAVVGNLAGEP